MRKFLYSKWFFGFLAFVCSLAFVTDIAEGLWGGEGFWGNVLLNIVSPSLDLIAIILTMTIFLDLHRRIPTHGRDPRG